MRNILTSTLFQYGTKFQAFKHTGTDRIVERIIYTSPNEYVDTNEIQNSYKKDIGYVLPLNIFDDSLERLKRSNRIIPSPDGSEHYKLDEKVKKEHDSNQSNFDRNIQRVTDKLFNNAPGKKASFIEPFWFSMSFIFSNLGKYSAKLIEGQLDSETFLKPVLQRCCQRIRGKYKIDHDYFEKRILHFFEETKEHFYNTFKWTVAQNYFIANSLGINPYSKSLSYDIFKDSIFYLDTNILLNLTSKNGRYYSNTMAFIQAALKAEIKFCVADITLKEYYRWVSGEKERILETKNQIPEGTKSKVGSVIYQDFVEKSLESTSKVGILEEIIKSYLEIKVTIEDIIPKNKISFTDDLWFDAIEKDEIFEKTKKEVIEKYKISGTRTKGENAAIHDAKVLLWIDKEKNDSQNPVWFITADASLPLVKINGAEKSDSILLEVVLQWLGPLTKQDDSQEYQEAFAEILKNRLLPNDILFEVNDFLIFEELHMECAELPSEDVEECIIYIRKNAPNLNPNDPRDREVLANKIAVYFADPSRKYKKELSEKIEENESLRTKLGDVSTLVEDLKKSNIEKDNEIGDLRKTQRDQEENFNRKISSLEGLLSEIQNNQVLKDATTKFKDWCKKGWYSLITFVVFLIIGILELLPSWSWNLPAKLVDYFNDVEAIDKTRFNLFIILNGFLLTSILVSLFVYSFNRLWNKEKRKKKLQEFENGRVGKGEFTR